MPVHMDGRADGRRDSPYFRGPFRLLPGVQKHGYFRIEKTLLEKIKNYIDEKLYPIKVNILDPSKDEIVPTPT